MRFVENPDMNAGVPDAIFVDLRAGKRSSSPIPTFVKYIEILDLWLVVHCGAGEGVWFGLLRMVESRMVLILKAI